MPKINNRKEHLLYFYNKKGVRISILNTNTNIRRIADIIGTEMYDTSYRCFYACLSGKIKEIVRC